MSPHWFDDVDTVSDFAATLDQAGEFDDKDELQEYYKSPYLWDPEYQQWLALDCPGIESDAWEQFVTYLEER